MKLPRRNFLHLAVGAAAVPAVSRIAGAQAYPARPVRIIAPTAPGGAPCTGRSAWLPLGRAGLSAWIEPPQRGAAFALTRASRRARTRSIGSRSRAFQQHRPRAVIG